MPTFLSISYHLAVWLSVAIALASCTPAAPPAEEATSRRPNVLLIMSDDQGWGDLSLHGNPNLRTPHIDALAAEGVAFDRFFVSPVCSPTRAELLTGRYHTRGGVYSTSAGGERLDLDETTVAQHFQRAGYRTAAYGKWHNGTQYPYHPNARGFDDFYGFCSGHWGNYFGPMLERNGEIVRGGGYIVDDLTNQGIAFIEQKRETPFFLYMPYNTPHSPMQVPDRWWNRLANQPLDSLNRDPSQEDTTFTRAALAMVENIDWNVGRLLQALEETGQAENTIVLYLSDNGPNSWRWNGDMKGRKGATDEGGVRSPLLIRWPDSLEAGTYVTQIAGAIDILPTLVDLTGISAESEKTLDGLSLKSLLRGDTSNWPARTLINHWRESTSVRSQRYRLDDEGQLFDMVADPGQRTNVATGHPKIVKTLTAARQVWEADALAELPAEDTRALPVGHPSGQITQLPARDGVAHGGIRRSNRYPNSSFFTNWRSPSDSITFNVEVVEEGDFEVVVYYTCSPEDIGSTVALSFGGHEQTFTVSEAHNQSLLGAKNDRYERIESYEQDFQPMNAGTLHLPQGKGTITLKALDIPGEEVMDFRLLLLRRQSPGGASE
ncbi:MAG: sulfatase-like hydrolase/transferase [Tunicatimonas sp.]